MKEETRKALQEALDYCNDEDKSDAFTIQYMQDYAKVSFDTVIEFLKSISINGDDK